MVEIAPSILAADFTRLGDQVRAAEAGGARMLHVDVMDGHFVPNLTIGVPVVASLRRATRLALDCHLMIQNADQWISPFIDAGADMVSVHQEACPHLDRTLAAIRGAGASPGVVLNPATPAHTLDEVLELVDYVLVMSVNPGFGGQRFIPRSLEKVRQLRDLRSDRGLNYRIEIDGGITLDNVAEAARAGCDIIVAGTSVFQGGDPAGAVAALSRAAGLALALVV